MNDKNETPKIIRLVETDSTNNYLREQSAKARLPEGSLVIADFQTAGKGQVGNSWESEAGKNLMFSILLYPDFPSCEPTIPDFPDCFPECERNVGEVHGFRHGKMAERYLLERS